MFFLPWKNRAWGSVAIYKGLIINNIEKQGAAQHTLVHRQDVRMANKRRDPPGCLLKALILVLKDSPEVLAPVPGSVRCLSCSTGQSLSACPFLSVLFSLPLSVCPFQSVLLLPSCSAFSLPILFSVTPILCPISWCFLVIFKVANIQSIAYFLILQVKHFAMKTACFRLMLIFSDFPISLFTSKYRTTKRNRENAKW